MNGSVVVTGMVLSATPIGEFDKRIVILTREKGKISAFAKGARRQNSALLAAAVPFSFGEFTMYEGRNSNTVVQASISNYFSEIKEDLEKVCYASYFAEFADYYAREYNDELLLLKLLYQTLRALASGRLSSELIRYIYELKVLVVNGEYPEMFACSVCGSSEDLQLFSFDRKGMICSSCSGSERGLWRLLPAAVYTIQYIISSEIQKLYTFTVTDEVLEQLKAFMDKYVKANVDHTFKSLDFLIL